MSTAIIDHHARSIARARLALEEAQAVHTAAVGEVGRLQQRIADCESRRSEITHRRLAGESSEAEATEFVALAGDLDVLRELLADAQAKADQLFPGEQRNALARAEAALQEHQQQAEFDALIERTREVEAAYVQALGQVWEAVRERGHVRTFGEVFPLHQTLLNLARFNSFTGLGVRQ
ncbi:hypothetical protein [Ottowia sp.]|uniref:hypothetical protein n=1 Tax=Ottowia sp. TaxID=1898956 RepID=UPI002B8D88AB|nr:hypothetical protein [Ottowia sp.]HOB66625.1 hypothetical protein [Ottowia sp.]HPZ56481.1 hypothetical protein [Ottowia sp.]HQD47621.1 hypothetical protein [Ottowia sp.]